MTAILYLACLWMIREAEKHQLTGGWLLHWLTASYSSLWFTPISRLNKSILHIEQHKAYRRDSLLWNVPGHKKKYCTCTHINARAVIVMGCRPQSVGRQPVSQNEAQSNHSEMNTLEDSQTTTSNAQTHTESERKETVNLNSC